MPQIKRTEFKSGNLNQILQKNLYNAWQKLVDDEKEQSKSPTKPSLAPLTRHGYTKLFPAGPGAQLTEEARAKMLEVSVGNIPDPEVVKLSELVEGAGTHIEIIKSKESSQQEQWVLGMITLLITDSIDETPEGGLLEKYQGLASMGFISDIFFNSAAKFRIFDQASEGNSKLVIDIRSLSFNLNLEKQKLATVEKLENTMRYSENLVSIIQSEKPANNPRFRVECSTIISKIIERNKAGTHQKLVDNLLKQYKFKEKESKPIFDAILFSIENPELFNYMAKYNSKEAPNPNETKAFEAFREKTLQKYSTSHVIHDPSQYFKYSQTRTLQAKKNLASSVKKVLDKAKEQALPQEDVNPSKSTSSLTCRIPK